MRLTPHTDGMNILPGRATPSQTLPGAGAWVRGPPARVRWGMGKPGFPIPLFESLCSPQDMPHTSPYLRRVAVLPPGDTCDILPAGMHRLVTNIPARLSRRLFTVSRGYPGDYLFLPLCPLFKQAVEIVYDRRLRLARRAG